jgi:hypothetical protein
MTRTVLTGLALASLLGVARARAQSPWALNIAGGVSVPTGDLSDRVSTGWHGLASVSLSSVTQVYGLRFDAEYNRFGYSGSTALGRLTTTSGTVNLTYRLPRIDSPFSPYLITGLGVYVTDCSAATGCGSAAHYGWNIGLGTKWYVLGLHTFLEARYHRTAFHGASVYYFPLTFGITL